MRVYRPWRDGCMDHQVSRNVVLIVEIGLDVSTYPSGGSSPAAIAAIAESEIEPHVGRNLVGLFFPLGGLRGGPQPSKGVHHVWTMTSIVVIRHCIDQDAPSRESVYDPHSLGQLRGAVNDGLVPDLGPPLNALAITEPAHISEVRRDGIASVEKLVRAQHPRMND